jgi:hypothetical protein
MDIFMHPRPIKFTSQTVIGLVTLVALIVLPMVAEAQCAMCRATVESNAQNGNVDAADGLNTGILYLMSLPYILFSIIGFFWYRSTKRKQALLKSKTASKIGGTLAIG